MKTAEEWYDAWIRFPLNEPRESDIDLITSVQRDTWEAATKAQIERTWGNSAAAETVTPAPFPGETK
jgi:hypothetical protein